MSKCRHAPLHVVTRRAEEREQQDRLWRDYHQSSSWVYVSFEDWLEIHTAPWPVTESEIAAATPTRPDHVGPIAPGGDQQSASRERGERPSRTKRTA
jgi:hypothetical protein